MGRRIFLIGYMASGKSWVGKELALITGLTFIDLDQLFETTFRITILDFFEKYGEPLFRKLESNLLDRVCEQENILVSTGGGTPCFHGNMDKILQHGLAIFLDMPVADLNRRIQLIRKKRPLLKDIPPEELEMFINSQLKSREPYYRKAHHTIPGPDYEMEEMAGLIRSFLTSNATFST